MTEQRHMTWSEVLADAKGRQTLFATLAGIAIALFSYTRFLRAVEARQGVSFIDPVHALVGPIDLTWPIFLVLYGGLILAIAVFASRPLDLLAAMRTYTILIVLRMACMWSLPLDPPPTMITLADPFVEMFTAGSAALTRDLFFSGHTSILVMMALIVRTRRLRIVFGVLAAVMAVAVTLQHVHYTVDVLVAPMAAWLAVTIAGAHPTDRQAPRRS